MGGKSSKSELKRQKTFSSLGRSSQRCLFQKIKINLHQINKTLQTLEGAKDSVALDEIKQKIEHIEKELDEVSQTIKDKNKNKHEEILKYFQETRQKFEDKVKPQEENEKVEELPESPELENARQTVELKLVQVVGSEDVEEPEVEMRKAPYPEESGERNSQERTGSSSKVKFGVQVMPLNPRVSQEILTRRTFPVNEAPKAEFEKIRNLSEGSFSSTNTAPSIIHKQSATNNNNNNYYALPIKSEQTSEPNSSLKENELYNSSLPVFAEPYEVIEIPGNDNKIYSLPSSPNFVKKQEGPLEKLEKRPLNADALQEIELVSKEVDYLDNKLKYFNGKKGDADYIELHERFIRSMIQLDNVDAQGDSVVRQERKIGIQRIQDLIKILERLVEQVEGEKREIKNVGDLDYEYDYVGQQQEETVNTEGKPITATAL